MNLEKAHDIQKRSCLLFIMGAFLTGMAMLFYLTLVQKDLYQKSFQTLSFATSLLPKSRDTYASRNLLAEGILKYPRPTAAPSKRPSKAIVSSNTAPTITSSDTLASSSKKSNSKPNIIFILADDLGFNSIGNEDLDLDFATTFLSQLAKKSITIKNYYSQESCTPARAALLTGRYPLSIGVQLTSINAYATNALNEEETLLSEALREEGYTSYMIGKWNLGHFHPKYLPTGRGFDYFLAFMDGQTYYWSKKNPKLSQFTDLMYGNGSCYAGYDGSDRHDYSTFLYRNKAIAAIEAHDYNTSPMFMYLAFQAVHDPFYDYDNFASGIPKSYLDADMYETFMSSVVGRKRKQYAMALALMDGAVNDIYSALDAQNQLSNSYVIFTSDNGGCWGSGGKNGDYRGTKGSLWEGGTKVDAFIFSPLFPDSLWGSQYEGLMHVTDWMPTILDMAGASFLADEDYPLDGVSHFGYLKSEEIRESNPRKYLLYNYIVDVGGKTFDADINAPLAVRDQDGHKLIHAYVGNQASQYYTYDTLLDDDGNMILKFECTQSDSMSGDSTYTKLLFDLQKDPYETTNLYDDEDYSHIKKKLYKQIDKAYARHTACKGDGNAKTNKHQKKIWKAAGNFIVPWADISSHERNKYGYADACASTHMLSPVLSDGDDEPVSPHPSMDPTLRPTESPSESPSQYPLADATFLPTDDPSTVPSMLSTTSVPVVQLSVPPSPSFMLLPSMLLPTAERFTSPPSPSLMLLPPMAELTMPPSPSAMLEHSSEPTTMPSLRFELFTANGSPLEEETKKIKY